MPNPRGASSAQGSHFGYVEPSSTHLTPQETSNHTHHHQGWFGHSQPHQNESSHPNGAISQHPSGEPTHHSPDPFAIVPRVQWKLQPEILLKIRKCFYPLSVTRLSVGANINPQTRRVMFTWSWRDRIIGGRIEFEDRKISLTKLIDVDKRTKLDLRVAFDLDTRRTLFSVVVLPFQGITANQRPSGLSMKQRLNLDKRLSVDVQARLTLPEARFSTDTSSAVSLGEGDFVLDLERLDFRFLLD